MDDVIKKYLDISAQDLADMYDCNIYVKEKGLIVGSDDVNRQICFSHRGAEVYSTAKYIRDIVFDLPEPLLQAKEYYQPEAYEYVLRTEKSRAVLAVVGKEAIWFTDIIQEEVFRDFILSTIRKYFDRGIDYTNIITQIINRSFTIEAARIDETIVRKEMQKEIEKYKQIVAAQYAGWRKLEKIKLDIAHRKMEGQLKEQQYQNSYFLGHLLELLEKKQWRVGYIRTKNDGKIPGLVYDQTIAPDRVKRSLLIMELPVELQVKYTIKGGIFYNPKSRWYQSCRSTANPHFESTVPFAKLCIGDLDRLPLLEQLEALPGLLSVINLNSTHSICPDLAAIMASSGKCQNLFTSTNVDDNDED